ncbi:TPA: hypothetical protein ACGSSW_004473 [Klebsiella pneumoniae]
MKNGKSQFFVILVGYLVSAALIVWIAWVGEDKAGLLGSQLPYLDGGMVNSNYLPVSIILNNYSIYIGVFLGALVSLLMFFLIEPDKINGGHHFPKVFIGCVLVVFALIFMTIRMNRSDLVNANYMFRAFSYSYISTVFYYLLSLFFFYVMSLISVLGLVVLPLMMAINKMKKAGV